MGGVVKLDALFCFLQNARRNDSSDGCSPLLPTLSSYLDTRMRCAEMLCFSSPTALSVVIQVSLPGFEGFLPPVELSPGEPTPDDALDTNGPHALADPYDRAQIALHHTNPPKGLDPCRRPLSMKALLEILTPVRA